MKSVCTFVPIVAPPKPLGITAERILTVGTSAVRTRWVRGPSPVTFLNTRHRSAAKEASHQIEVNAR